MLKYDCFMGCECPIENADIVLFSAPYDGTTSFRPGARFAGRAIRENSYGIESYSPYTEKDLYDLKIADIGELELPFGSSQPILESIEETVEQILSDGKKPFMVGGEHLVTLGAIHAAFKKFPNLHILHFDAHADLRYDYLGELYSHATVIRRCWDIVGDGKIYQMGIRSGDKEEFEFAAKHTKMIKFNLNGIENIIRELENKPVYFTLDLDILDPSFFSGTGTPEPGGISFAELQNAVHLLKELNIVGCDVVELSPHYDQSGVSTVTACKIIRELLMVVSK